MADSEQWAQTADPYPFIDPVWRTGEGGPILLSKSPPNVMRIRTLASLYPAGEGRWRYRVWLQLPGEDPRNPHTGIVDTELEARLFALILLTRSGFHGGEELLERTLAAYKDEQSAAEAAAIQAATAAAQSWEAFLADNRE